MQKGNRISGKKNSGFSMVELIVTVAILAIISVGGVSAYRLTEWMETASCCGKTGFGTG